MKRTTVQAPPPQADACDYFWGSHGCDLTMDGHTIHQCGKPGDECCQYDEDTHQVRFADGGFGEPFEGWREWGTWSAKGWHMTKANGWENGS